MIEYRNLRGKDGKPGESDGKLHGRAAPFNSETQIGGDKWGFREKIKPGAFKKSLSEGDVVLLDNHDTSKPIARQSAGTLRPVENKAGLDWDADPANTTYANDAMENARAGNYGGCSFGFEVIKDSWTRGENGALDLRTLEEVRLHEISVCTFPAYAATSVATRAREEASLTAARESREKALGPIDMAPGTDETQDADNDAPEGDADPARANTKPYGNVTYADPKNGKYPVDTKKHAKAAWGYINQKINAAKYPLNGVSLASVKAKIKAACKKFGVKVAETNDELAYEAAELRSLVDDLLGYQFRDTEYGANAKATLEAVRDFLDERADEAADPYADEFYERDDDNSDAEDADDGDAEDDEDRDTKQCPTCKGKKNVPNDDGDMKTCPKCKGKGTVARSEETSGESRDGEPGNPTRTDDERRDALRALRVKSMRAANDGSQS